MLEVDVRLGLRAPRQAVQAGLATAGELGRRGDDTRAQRLGQKEDVSRLCAAFTHDLARMNNAGNAQAIEWLRIGHGVAAGDRRPRLTYLDRTAGEHLGHR